MSFNQTRTRLVQTLWPVEKYEAGLREAYQPEALNYANEKAAYDTAREAANQG